MGPGALWRGYTCIGSLIMISTLRAEDAQSTNAVNSASKAEPSSLGESTEEKEAAEQAELVKKTLNPVADLISVPIGAAETFMWIGDRSVDQGSNVSLRGRVSGSFNDAWSSVTSLSLIWKF